MIEIITRDTCPTCGGTGRFTVPTQPGESITCPTCNGRGTVPRVLATFADEATLRKKVNNAIGFAIGDLGSVSGTTVRTVRDAVLAVLGVNDDHS